MKNNYQTLKTQLNTIAQRLLVVALLTFTMGVNAQYCNSNLGGGCGNSQINDFSIVSTTLSNLNSGCGTNLGIPNYNKYTGAGNKTATLNQAASYTFSGKFDATTVGAGVWIDYDHSGSFDAIEFTSWPTPSATASSITVSIPNYATVGTTGMRVRSWINTINSYDACNYFWSGGETEDYTITIGAGTPCVGAPSAGVLSASTLTPCTGNLTTLNLTGATSAVGITYSWQTSIDNVNWSTTGDSLLQSFDYGLATGDSIYYRVEVSCNAGTPVVSNVIKLTPNTSTYACYCSSAANNTIDDDIGAFSFGAFNNIQSVTPALNNPTSVNTYTNYTNLGPIQVQQGATSLVSITQINSAGYYNCTATVYIDFDHSGTYDAGEDVYTGNSSNVNNVITGAITIPDSALTGITGVRVVLVEGFPNSCGAYSFGETEDYLININVAVPCAGTPTAGTLNITDTMVCAGTNLNLVLAGNTQGAGITTEWETSADGLTGWAATGDTIPVLSVFTPSDSIYFRVKTSCNAGAPVYSTVAKIKGSPAYLCYCNSSLNTDCFGAKINNVTIAGTSLNNTTSCTGTGYALFYPTTVSTTANLQQALTYTVTVSMPNATIGGVWLDTDLSGTFDGTEYTALSISGITGTATINIPSATPIGKIGMRVRTYNGTWPPFSSGSACSYLFGGEVEDYIVNIITGTPCSTPVAGTLSATNSAPCAGTMDTLNLVGASQAVGITYVWETSIDGLTWSATGDSSLQSFDYGISTGDSIYYRVQVACNAGTPVMSNIIKL
ncbi:MAG: GEVED domain-containing protein, partial [Bacteroidia bacterium]